MPHSGTDDAKDPALEELRATVRASVAKAAQRSFRRAKAIRGDLAKIEEAEVWAKSAAWLVPAAARAPRGTKVLEGSDWSTGEEVIVEVPLDPALAPRAQVEAMFRKARRLREGKPIATSRLHDAEVLHAALLPLIVEVDAASDAKMLAELLARAQALAPKDFALQSTKTRPTSKIQEKKPPFRTFVGAGDIRILVGRGASQNDELTFDVARLHHLWLHAKGHTGAHVVAWIGKGHDPTQELLVDAAHLAAHFSDARGEPLVEVTYVARRYVRKPRRSPPGLVVVEREKVMTLRMEPGRLAALLATEVEADLPPSLSRRK
ncbi:MAG: NFACT RNA binding domain-containing protein [Polyangiaceae bacterium]